MLHPAAWLWWVLAAVTTILSVDQPIATSCVVAALSIVAAACSPRGPESRSFALMVKIGLVFLAFRVILFGLTGHTGPTTLFVLPEAHVPAWIGGFALGGRITAEVVSQAVSEGLKIAAVLAAFGVFFSVVPVSKLMRMLPRFLFEAGLIIGIALTFVPVMVRTASEIRDAQRMRGHRFRGLRALRPLVVPVLAGAMERSLTLAASMEVRGYGRGGPAHVPGRRVRTVVALSLLATGAGASALLFGKLAGAPAVGAGIAGLAWAQHELLGASPRTRYRPQRLERWDKASIALSASTVIVAVAARLSGHGWWYAYPVARLPDAHALSILPAVLLVAPAVLAGIRTVATARADRPVLAIEPVEAPR